jgi:hypothetical protein
MPMCHDRDICTGIGRFAAIGTVIALLLTIWPGVAIAESKNSQLSQLNLFLLPLEEVLRIDTRSSEEMHVLSRRVALGLIRQRGALPHTRKVGKGLRLKPEWTRPLARKVPISASRWKEPGKRPKIAKGFANASDVPEGLLLVDGWELGLAPVRDLSAYLGHFKQQLQRLEIYTGESAFWLSDGRSSLVINIITPSQAPDASVRDTLTQEGGR